MDRAVCEGDVATLEKMGAAANYSIILQKAALYGKADVLAWVVQRTAARKGMNKIFSAPDQLMVLSLALWHSHREVLEWMEATGNVPAAAHHVVKTRIRKKQCAAWKLEWLSRNGMLEENPWGEREPEEDDVYEWVAARGWVSRETERWRSWRRRRMEKALMAANRAQAQGARTWLPTEIWQKIASMF